MKILHCLFIIGTLLSGLNFQLMETNRPLIINSNTFDQRLEEVLTLTEKEYKSAGANFGINFSTKSMVIFQIIKRTLLENAQTIEFGYGIHLSFDDSFPETKKEFERFKNLNLISQFDSHVWDGIPTYQIDLKVDKDQIISLSKQIIQIVYLEDVNEIDLDAFEI